MRRRFLFDAPTNCTAQVRARIQAWNKSHPVQLAELRARHKEYVDQLYRDSYADLTTEQDTARFAAALRPRPATVLWVVDVQFYPNDGGISVTVNRTLHVAPRYTFVQELDELDDHMEKRIYAEPYDEAMSVKPAWLDRPYP
jgi:hypothetical protein